MYPAITNNRPEADYSKMSKLFLCINKSNKCEPAGADRTLHVKCSFVECEMVDIERSCLSLFKVLFNMFRKSCD